MRTVAPTKALPLSIPCEKTAVKSGSNCPVPHLAVARALGMAPGECVVIEDSQNGIIAARRAGMRCVALVPPGGVGTVRSDADVVVSDLARVTDEVLLAGQPTDVTSNQLFDTRLACGFAKESALTSWPTTTSAATSNPRSA